MLVSPKKRWIWVACGPIPLDLRIDGAVTRFNKIMNARLPQPPDRFKALYASTTFGTGADVAGGRIAVV
ncbi:hypothetical protein, partial [Acidithiobacillus caldus]